MASVNAFIGTSKKRADKVHIRFRLRDGRTMQLFHKSEIEVDPALWDSKKQEIKAKVVFDSVGRVYEISIEGTDTTIPISHGYIDTVKELLVYK